MNRYASLPKQRTKADRERDLVMFLTMAAPDRVRAASSQELATRYGVDLKLVEIRHRAALERLGL